MEVWCAHALGSGHRTNIGAAVLLVGDPVQDDFDVDMYSRHDEQYKSTLISKFSKIISIQSLVGPAKCEQFMMIMMYWLIPTAPSTLRDVKSCDATSTEVRSPSRSFIVTAYIIN